MGYRGVPEHFTYFSDVGILQAVVWATWWVSGHFTNSSDIGVLYAVVWATGWATEHFTYSSDFGLQHAVRCGPLGGLLSISPTSPTLVIVRSGVGYWMSYLWGC